MFNGIKELPFVNSDKFKFCFTSKATGYNKPFQPIYNLKYVILNIKKIYEFMVTLRIFMKTERHERSIYSINYFKRLQLKYNRAL